MLVPEYGFILNIIIYVGEYWFCAITAQVCCFMNAKIIIISTLLFIIFYMTDNKNPSCNNIGHWSVTPKTL